MSIFDQEATTGGVEPGDETPPAALGDTYQELEDEQTEEEEQEPDPEEE